MRLSTLLHDFISLHDLKHYVIIIGYVIRRGAVNSAVWARHQTAAGAAVPG
jgi:hypothetical protein